MLIDYGEPWELKDGLLIWRVCQADGTPVWTDPNGDKLFQRAVDCVNALQGLDPSKLGQLLSAAREVETQALYYNNDKCIIPTNAWVDLSQALLRIKQYIEPHFHAATDTMESIQECPGCHPC